MQIRPIRNELDHALVVDRISQLMSAAPDSAEGDELEVLATLADAWEAKHHLMAAPDPITAIQFRMEQQGLTRKDLEPILGSRARVSEVLGRRRNLTLSMIRRLRESLQLTADVLIQPSFTEPVPRRKAPAVHRAVLSSSQKSRVAVRKAAG